MLILSTKMISEQHIYAYIYVYMHRDDNVTYNFPDVNFIKLEELWSCLYEIGP